MVIWAQNYLEDGEWYGTYGFSEGVVGGGTARISVTMNIVPFQASSWGQQSNGGSDPVDPSTLGRNFFWTHYIGPWNPKTENGFWDYSVAPKNAADFNAYIHDISYDGYGAVGFQSVLFDRCVIFIDERFISGQWQVMTGRGYSLTERFQAGISGAFIDGATIPKRFVHQVIEIEYGFNGFINNMISSWMGGYR